MAASSNIKQTMDYTKPVVLTSPLTKYPTGKVELVQQLLAGSNVFHVNYGPGKVDDVMGTLTRGAIKRCKIELGYPDPDGAFGETLYEYLSGLKPLPKAYLKTQKSRQAKAEKVVAIKVKALEWALTQVGTKEDPPGSNHNPYGKEYGFDGVAWCAEFVCCAQVKAGNKNFILGHFSAAVQDYYNAAESHTHGLSLTSAPTPGDLVIYNKNEHVEEFEEWIDQSAGTFWAVGGNTSSSDGSYNNGGEVARNQRSINGTRTVNFAATTA